MAFKHIINRFKGWTKPLVNTSRKEAPHFLGFCYFVDEYITVLQKLANSRQPESKSLHDGAIMTYNGRGISPCKAYDKILDNGDNITILPVYMGG